MRRLEAGSELQQLLVDVGFVPDEGRLGPGRRASYLEPGHRLSEMWELLDGWCRTPIDEAEGEDDLLLFEAFLDLDPPAMYREDRPAFVVSFKRQVEFREDPDGPIVAGSVIRVQLAFDVSAAPPHMDPSRSSENTIADSVWHQGGSDAYSWRAAVEATKSFQAVRDQTIRAGSFFSDDVE